MWMMARVMMTVGKSTRVMSMTKMMLVQTGNVDSVQLELKRRFGWLEEGKKRKRRENTNQKMG